MSKVKYRDVVQDSAGNAVAGASVSVLNTGTATLASIFIDDGVTARSNPIITDATGGFEFTVEEGTYDLSVAIAGFATVVQNKVEIGAAETYLVINTSAAVLPTATGTEAIAMGDGAVASGNYAIGIGKVANATAQDGVAIGNSADATGNFGVAIGENAQATATGGVAVSSFAVASGYGAIAAGINAEATFDSAVALGRNADAKFTQSTAIGAFAATTKANQVVLGTATEEVTVPGTLVAAGNISTESLNAVARLSLSSTTARLNLFNTSNNFSVLKEADYLAIGLTGSETSGLVLDSAGAVATGGDSLKITTSKTPASAAATGVAGQIAWDSDFIYVCVATNTWKRVAIATWP